MEFDTGNLILFTLAMIGSAFFSGVETGITSASLLKLEAEAEKGHRRYGLLARLVPQKENLVSMSVIANNITIIIMAVLLTDLAKTAMGKVILTIVETIVIVIFAEIIPKALFRRYPEKLLYLVAYPVIVLRYLFWPLSWLVTQFSLLVLRIFGLKDDGSRFMMTRQDLSQLAQMVAESDQNGEGKPVDGADQVQAVFELDQTHAAEVMTPRYEMRMISQESTLSQVIEFAASVHYTKIPVFDEHPDNIAGYVSITDLLFAAKNDSLTKFIHPAVFAPETKNAVSLMHEWSEHGQEIVFIVNEYNVLVGLVTREDLVEQIVGDVYSTERREREPVRRRNDGSFEIDCKITLDDLNERLALNVESETERTLAGFLLEKFGHFPPAGTSLRDYLRGQALRENPELTSEDLAEIAEAVPNFIVRKRTDRAIQSAVLELEPSAD